MVKRIVIYGGSGEIGSTTARLLRADGHELHLVGRNEKKLASLAAELDSRFVGDVFGSALAAEGIFAFFLESGFLAIVAFGRSKVSAGLYLFSMYVVALGSIFSSIGIIVANSWQQTPAGSHIVDILRPVTAPDGSSTMVPWVVDGVVQRRAEIVDFMAMVFNPMSAQRLSHVLLGCLAFPRQS